MYKTTVRRPAQAHNQMPQSVVLVLDVQEHNDELRREANELNSKLRGMQEESLQIDTLKKESEALRKMAESQQQQLMNAEYMQAEMAKEIWQVRVENDSLRGKLQAEAVLRQDLKELQKMNNMRKEAMAAATSTINSNIKSMEELMLEKQGLQIRIQQLEEENSRQAIAIAKATLGRN